MRSKIVAIGLACLLSFAAPVYGADLVMPVKAPPPVVAPPPVAFEWWPLLFLIPVAVCIAVCSQHEDRPVSPGGGFRGGI